jgi:hypothetical protein
MRQAPDFLAPIFFSGSILCGTTILMLKRFWFLNSYLQTCFKKLWASVVLETALTQHQHCQRHCSVGFSDVEGNASSDIKLQQKFRARHPETLLLQETAPMQMRQLWVKTFRLHAYCHLKETPLFINVYCSGSRRPGLLTSSLYIILGQGVGWGWGVGLESKGEGRWFQARDLSGW